MQIQTKLETLGKYSCLFTCYLWIVCKREGKRFDDLDFVKLFDLALAMKLVDEEVTVLNPDGVMSLISSKHYTAAKSDKPEGPECCARFDNNGFSHWVVVDESNNILFNSLDKSVCVERGKIGAYRVVKEMK